MFFSHGMTLSQTRKVVCLVRWLTDDHVHGQSLLKEQVSGFGVSCLAQALALVMERCSLGRRIIQHIVKFRSPLKPVCG